MKPTATAPTDANNQPKPVLQGNASDRTTLAAIAHQAMIEHDLEPDFPLAAQQELAAIVRPAKATENVRDCATCFGLLLITTTPATWINSPWPDRSPAGR